MGIHTYRKHHSSYSANSNGPFNRALQERKTTQEASEHTQEPYSITHHKQKIHIVTQQPEQQCSSRINQINPYMLRKETGCNNVKTHQESHSGTYFIPEKKASNIFPVEKPTSFAIYTRLKGSASMTQNSFRGTIV